jgi:hypothetical protein
MLIKNIVKLVCDIEKQVVVLCFYLNVVIAVKEVINEK